MLAPAAIWAAPLICELVAEAELEPAGIVRLNHSAPPTLILSVRFAPVGAFLAYAVTAVADTPELSAAIGAMLEPIAALNSGVSATAVTAYAKNAPTGANLTLNINVGGALWLSLTIPAGSNSASATSSQISGAAQIAAGASITLDLTAVGTISPGSDLSVFLYF